MPQFGELIAIVLAKVFGEEDKEPTITARWSKKEVFPVHNNAWPPASPPTDAIPKDSKVELIVKTKNVPDGTTASIVIRHCEDLSPVEDGYLGNLEVKGNKVVDSATNKPPEWVFEADNMPYDPWDTPFFFFTVLVNHQALWTMTPHDFKGEEAKTLRVFYWHMLIADKRADRRDSLTTRAEIKEIGKILAAVDKHKIHKHVFNQRRVPRKLWGSLIRNSYVYHQASHGNIKDRRRFRRSHPSNNCPPPGPVGNWHSVLEMYDTIFNDTHVADETRVPSTPRYLVYLNICLAGWESSFGNAFIFRGTQNVIAFRCSIPDSKARRMARRFYRSWCRTHKYNPIRIAEVFWDVGAPYYRSMRPVLYGRGGGRITRRRLDNQLQGLMCSAIADLDEAGK